MDLRMELSDKPKKRFWIRTDDTGLSKLASEWISQ